MQILFKTLIVLLLVMLLIAISTAVFVGTGYLISLMLPLTLFEASVLCIAASFVAVFALSGGRIGRDNFDMFSNYRDDDEYSDEEWEDDEEDEDEDEDDYKKRVRDILEKDISALKSIRANRNNPDRGGKGKKYKK